MDKSVLLNRFNTTAEEFCKDLVIAFPEVKEFKQLKTGLLLLKNVNEKQPRELFQKYVADSFRDKIVARDEEFFLTESHDHIAQIDIVRTHVLGGDASQWQTVLTLLRSLWAGLSDTNKENIWKYFQVLIAINDRYVA